MNELTWGLIGAAEKAKAFKNDLPYATHPHRLAAVLSVDEWSEEIEGVTLYNDLHQFLQSGVDAVYIASPYTMHYAQVKQCLLRGIAVLCERPIAQSAEELEHLMRIAEHNRAFMMEAMWVRFMPSIKKVLSVISSGAIGEIVSVKASLSYKESSPADVLNPGGGALVELGIYPVFLCTLLLGRPEYVQATGRLNKEGVDDFFSAFLSYESGQYGFIETSKMMRGESVATITGDKGTIQVRNPWNIKPEGIEVDFFDGTKVLHKSEWEGQGLYFELDEVYECLQQHMIESQLYCHHFNLDVMLTLDDIRRQMR